jgi:glycosyltransferase involved in cell wall biosynthesis
MIDNRTEPKTMLAYIPHGINTKKFYPIPKDSEDLLNFRNRILGEGASEVNFIVLYNSRNIRRKMTSDTILAFSTFIKSIPEESRKHCRLILHTTPVDDNGTDLPRVVEDVTPEISDLVIFSTGRVETNYLNLLYNISDVTINLASNEGFGLGTCESLATGTPIIVNVTGGLQDQCGFKNSDGQYIDPERDLTEEWGSNHDGRYREHGEWAFPVWPVSRALQGSPLTPYIFDDRCDWTDAAEQILAVYRLYPEERARVGELGRQYLLGPGQFSSDRMCELFIENIDKVIENWTPRDRYTIVKV